MIQIGSVHILTGKEFSKYEKLHRIFRVYSSQELDDILAGKIHLRRNPVKVLGFSQGVSGPGGARRG